MPTDVADELVGPPARVHALGALGRVAYSLGEILAAAGATLARS